ncbi:MAG: site-2 protease family protein [Phycisphaerae bacterium]
MFGRSIKLCNILGFEVRVDLSWLVILVLVVWSLSAAVFPGQLPDMHWVVYLGMGIVAAIGLFASIVVHELSHSLVARRFGIPMKGITLFMFGGVAEMNEQPPSAKAEFWMALGGPAASLVIGLLAVGLGALGRWIGWSDIVTAVLMWIGFINFILLAFNLIPGFPLDGGRVLRAILWHFKGDLRKATHAASRVGAVFGAVLIGLGVLNLLFLNAIGGLWWILIGLFVRSAAKQGYQQVLMRQMLRGEKVRRFMNSDCITVPADASVERFVEDYVYRHHFKLYPVVSDGDRLAGCVTTSEVKEIDRSEWQEKTVSDIARSCSDENSIAPDADAVDALDRMNKSKASRLMVVREGKLEGILALKDLMRFLSMKIDLESDSAAPSPPLDKEQVKRNLPEPEKHNEH